MNLKEKQITLYYLKNVFQTETVPEELDCLARLLRRSSEDLFGFDIRRMKLDADNIDFDEEYIRFFKGIINGEVLTDSLVTDAEKLELISNVTIARQTTVYNVNIEDKDYDASFTAICDAFDLAENCRKVLRYFVYSFKLSTLHKIIGCFNDRFHDEVMHDDNVEVISAFCKVPVEEVKKIISVNGPLFESGILYVRYTDKMFSSMFTKLIGVHFTCPKEVHDFLIGKPLITDLTRENFDYIQQDFDIMSDLLKKAVANKTKGVNILLYGHPGSGKTELSKAICAKAGLNLYTPTENKESKDDRLNSLSQVQTILKKSENTAILFDEAEDVFSLNPFSNNTPSKLFVNRKLENNALPVIWISNNISYMDEAYIRRFSLSIEVPDPDLHAKKNAWKRIFDKHGLAIDDERLSTLVDKYNIPMSVVDTGVKNAKMLGNIDLLEYTIDNIVKAMTGVAPSNKKSSDQKFNTDLLNTDNDLKKLADKIKEKNLKNFSLCLYGAPGTGKSAYARYLGELLGMPVIQKRCSDIQSKWIGETEKNIAKAFAEARKKKAILVFDEADSFLQDRNKAGRSWEITSVNEMLTQMENAEYPFICTTNLMQSLDKAALRRFSFKVKYDFLTIKQVAEAFKYFFDQDVEESEIADLTKLSPGDFKVIQSQAKFLDISDKKELIDKLRQEQAVKDVNSNGMTKNKIGF